MTTTGCGEYSDSLIDAWLSGDYLDAFSCVYEEQLGAVTFGAMLYGSLMVSLYIRTQSFVLPMVVSILGGTIAVSMLPAAYLQVLGMALLLGLSVAAYLLYRKAQTVA
jgi:hypothetical protein